MASPLADQLRSMAENIRRLRRRRGWSQEVLAEKASIDVRYVRTLESRKANPRANILIAVARALGVSLGPLFKRVKFSKRKVGRPPAA